MAEEWSPKASFIEIKKFGDIRTKPDLMDIDSLRTISVPDLRERYQNRLERHGGQKDIQKPPILIDPLTGMQLDSTSIPQWPSVHMPIAAQNNTVSEKRSSIKLSENSCPPDQPDWKAGNRANSLRIAACYPSLLLVRRPLEASFCEKKIILARISSLHRLLCHG